MAIIAVSFLIFGTIVVTTLTNYATESSYSVIRRTSENICTYLETGYTVYDSDSFNNYFWIKRDTIKNSINTLAAYDSETYIVITDHDGAILYCKGPTKPSFNDDFIPHSILEKIIRGKNGNAEFSGTLGNVFEEKMLICGRTIADASGESVGFVLACVGDDSVQLISGTLIKMIIVTSVCVLIAALLAVYLLTRRIISPLKQMSLAAKSFAAGKFDVRVPVVGRDEVAELATAFNSMAGSLQNLEDMRRTFIANVSHDLRSPMTTIGGFIDGILDGAIPPDKYDHYLRVIAGEVRRLSRLVSSLLDIAKIEGGERKFTMTRFDICEMGRQILISFEQKLEDKKLDVEFLCDEDNMYAFADRDAIYQIFYNICDNAVKFSYEGGKLQISVSRAADTRGTGLGNVLGSIRGNVRANARADEEKKLCVSVYNEGHGIPANDLPYVFDRFYKGDRSRGLDKTGTGLGLYIAKTIIDAHGEELSADSEEGKYCRFTFTLAAAEQTPQK